MKIWIDAQLSPFIAAWINRTFNDIEACSVRSLGLRDATDLNIFQQAKEQRAAVMSKDQDFLKLLELYGPPPQIIWITCGNTSNARMCEILTKVLLMALDKLKQGEPIVEISDRTI